MPSRPRLSPSKKTSRPNKTRVYAKRRSLKQKATTSAASELSTMPNSVISLISQLETGRGKVASDQYLIWAEALGVPHEEFVRAMLRYYDPVTYDILFCDRASMS